MSKFVIGIDPGFHGGISCLDTEHQTLYSVPMPVYEEAIRGKKKTYLDIHTISSLFSLDVNSVSMVYLEKVGAMPNQGVSSTFRFGENYGIIQGVIIKSGYPIRLISPRTWKGKYGLSDDKEASRRKASELFPKCVEFWKLKKHEGVAESAILAHYCALDLNYQIGNVIPIKEITTKQILME